MAGTYPLNSFPLDSYPDRTFPVSGGISPSPPELMPGGAFPEGSFVAGSFPKYSWPLSGVDPDPDPIIPDPYQPLFPGCAGADDCSTGLSLDEKQALSSVQCVINSRGSLLYLKLDDEQTVERDEFGSIKKRTASPAQPIYGLPIVFSPTQKQKDRLGIKESVQVLVTTPMQCWLNMGFTDKDLSHIDSIRATIILRGQTYEIRDKSLQDQFGSTFLYVVLGLNRK